MAAKSAEGKVAAETLKEKVHGQTVRIQGKVGRDGGKLFGAITAQDVADALKTQLGLTLEKKHVALVDPIKRLGHFSVMIDLHRDVDALVQVEVFDPEAPVVAEVAPESEPAMELESEEVGAEA